MKKNTDWRLAPAYDLCFAFDPSNHWVSRQTLSVNGKRSKITENDLMILARENNIKKGERIINDVNAVVKSWPEYARLAGVRQDLKERISDNLNTL
jgi:serine/threonine-protein kinase HipA